MIFNYGEFAIIKNQAGLNRFKISVKDFEKVYIILLLNPLEFEGFKKEAGLNAFTLSPKKWIDTTNAIGLIAKSGRYGGTYAHKDIAG